MTVDIDGIRFTQLTNLNIENVLYEQGQNWANNIAPLTLDSSSDPLVMPLVLIGGADEDNYTFENAGLHLNDAAGDEVWHIWGGDPNDGNANEDNFFMGLDTGHNVSTGKDLTAVGAFALQGVVSGTGTCAFGYRSLQSADTGQVNEGLGADTLRFLTDGSSNSAIGSGALEAVIFAGGNLAIGMNALNALVDFNNNTALGFEALLLVDGTSTNNTAIGHSAGSNLTDGDDNIFIGAGIQASSSTVSDELNIGDAIHGDMDGPAIIIEMPSTDPVSAGVLWNDSGTLKVSAGA